MEWIGPVNRVDYYLYAAANSSSLKAKSLEEVRGQRMGVLNGDVVDGFLTDREVGQLTRVSSFESLVKALKEAFDSLLKDGTWDAILARYQSGKTD